MKKLLKVLGVLVAVVIVGLLVLWYYVDTVAAKALTAGVEQAGGVKCKVDKVNVSLLSGSVGMNGLAIMNPAEYPAVEMMTLQEAGVEADLGSLLGSPVHVKKLEIIRPLIRIEAGKGGSNVSVFLDTVQSKFKSDAPTEKPKQDQPAQDLTRLHIDRLLIKDATVQIGSGFAPTKIADVTLETIELKDIKGKDGRGVTSGELSALILDELVRRGLIKTNLSLDKVVPVLAKGLQDGIGAVTGAGGGLMKGTGDVTTKATDAVLKGVGGLFQPKK